MKVSVIISTRNAERTLASCLASLRAQIGIEAEVIVVDNQSTDATATIAADADVLIVAGPERSAQRNIGAFASTGGVLVFVDADMVLEPWVLGQALERLNGPGVGAVVIPEQSFGQGFWARCKALEKRTVIGDPAVEAARVFRREDFFAVGGYDEALTACEDWDLADRVAAHTRLPAARTSSLIWHDEGRLRLRGTYAKKRYYGRWVAAWLTGAPEHRRRRSLRARLPWLLAQPVTGTGMVVMKLTEAAGFARGARDARKEQR
jgi:glycosyltransferase involved in cell wall biosynthesis